MNLSAYVDGELSINECRKLEAHLTGCAVCRESLEGLLELKQAFQSLPSMTIGFDLTPLIQGRSEHSKPDNRLWFSIRKIYYGWTVPFAAVCTLLMGVFLGSTLVNNMGSAATVPRSPVMAMFDVIPPGGLCIGIKSCYSQEKL
jgi:anti-sigma factor RsiW